MSMLVTLLVSCASQPSPPAGQLQVLSTAQGKPLTGAACVVSNLSGSWNVQTPATVMVGDPNGDLRVVCEHPGYRNSEVIYRMSGGGVSNSGTRVNVGVGGGSFGSASGVGVSMGIGFPLGTVRQRYPGQLTVDLTPLSDAR
ncbi:MAG: hypothetical protein LW805_07390 [Oxalobacteraceae bacterium]|nr:hypothetical protein [Oxalobacteraceae bacterium]